MKFKKYTSIENSHRKKFVADCVSAIELGYCKDDFVVEEKAHGANFAFYYDGTELKTASRSGFLEKNGEGLLQITPPEETVRKSNRGALLLAPR
mmetsp:Transcript_13892/g.32393  ORF Transcript_13892/g.32393 Transcript_13892/m.32393 type:complete len:94 (-) Transcript_13892:153-434(-)